MTLPPGCDGLRVRRMAVLWTFRELSLCRHVRRELLRNALRDFTSIIPATACHQRNYVETYSRSKSAESILLARGFAEGFRGSKPLQTPAKTHARNNVRIVDKGDKFPHYTEDVRALQ